MSLLEEGNCLLSESASQFDLSHTPDTDAVYGKGSDKGQHHQLPEGEPTDEIEEGMTRKNPALKRAEGSGATSKASTEETRGPRQERDAGLERSIESQEGR